MLQLVTVSGALPWALAIRESMACQVDTLMKHVPQDRHVYPAGRRRTILTSGAEGDPSLSFSTLPISQSEIRRVELALYQFSDGRSM
jgi:hypothetical protein